MFDGTFEQSTILRTGLHGLTRVITFAALHQPRLAWIAQRPDRGQTMLEYVLIIIVIGLTSMFIVRQFSISVRCKLLESTAAVTQEDVPGLSGCPGVEQLLAKEGGLGSSPQAPAFLGGGDFFQQGRASPSRRRYVPLRMPLIR